MSRLTRVLSENDRPRDDGDKKQKNDPIPSYDISGRAYESPKRRKGHRRLAALIIICGITAFIYLPQFFMGDQAEEETEAVALDAEAVKLNTQALRDCPDDDFDGDGLTNSEEMAYGTDPWEADTDGDGGTDYYEIKISDTSPTSPNSSLMTDLQTRLDNENGDTIATAYKINNVTLWPDNYSAKANGSVVETFTGYRFCDFSGYAKFSDDGSLVAYKYEDGVHEMLHRNSNDPDAWYVGGTCTVDLYTEELDEVVELGFLSWDVYLDASGFTEFLAKALPGEGFLTGRKMLKIDIEPDTSDMVTAEIQKPSYDSGDTARFMADTDSLSDLLYVFDAVNNGECVAVSLYRDSVGEYIGIVYGYLADGSLLIADADTLEPAGVLTVTEKARKMAVQDGSMVSVSSFGFEGLGMSSEAGDRISFFASTGYGGYSGMAGSPDVEEDDDDAEGYALEGGDSLDGSEEYGSPASGSDASEAEEAGDGEASGTEPDGSGEDASGPVDGASEDDGSSGPTVLLEGEPAAGDGLSGTAPEVSQD